MSGSRQAPVTLLPALESQRGDTEPAHQHRFRCTRLCLSQRGLDLLDREPAPADVEPHDGQREPARQSTNTSQNTASRTYTVQLASCMALSFVDLSPELKMRAIGRPTVGTTSPTAPSVVSWKYVASRFNQTVMIVRPIRRGRYRVVSASAVGRTRAPSGRTPSGRVETGRARRCASRSIPPGIDRLARLVPAPFRPVSTPRISNSRH